MDIMRIKIVTSGDRFLPNESAILIMNHRTRTDGLFLIKAMYQAVAPRVTSQRLKFIIKATVRHIPFAGWLIQTAGNLFVRRNWKVDEDHLSRWLDYELALNRRCQLVIFPEGTDLTLFTKWRSNKYAKSKGLPEYEYTLHPRSKGFTYLVRRLQQADYLDAIYDITIAYPDRVPQNELDILRGKMPDEVHIHVKRTAQTDLPKDELVLRDWLEDCWTQKNRILKEFYANKKFSNETWPAAVCNRALLWIVICFFIAITSK
ncbi:hypothetical protein QAD02_003938 [Eretmocerus hayati]|uniref:Uncharacterized protein n=1 Tax=Eretmocerus hayati TaxID=131215 RepID=A0ACC2NPB8_9HYME|nr:hypothetical protein QAD02_003938 [Eretmocerus hayati]